MASRRSEGARKASDTADAARPTSKRIARTIRSASSKKPKRSDETPSLFPDLPERIQVERSITTMGFFSVHSGIPADGNLERTVQLERNTEEGRVDAKATIASLRATGGFPGVEEQDVYYAILSAVTEAMAHGEEVPVPISFSPGELLRRMGKSNSGPNYTALKQQLKRLAGTTVVSEKSVYRSATGRWENSDHVFRIIDALIIKGETLDDGTVSDEHLIWLSPWQVENLIGHHRLIVDYQRYLLLSKPIARAIVPYLQLWLYASKKSGKQRCERYYDKLCELLGITVEKMPSKIRKQLGPPFQELIEAGYISGWSIEQAPGVFKKRYKLVFRHGNAFDDVELLGAAEESPRSDDNLSDDETRSFIATLVAAGVWDREARKLTRGLTREAWGRALQIVEYVREREKDGGLEDPGAFLAHLLRADRAEPVAILSKDRAKRPRAEPGARLPETIDAEIQRQAAAELEAHRVRESETNEIIRSLTPTQKAEIHARAFVEMQRDFPSSNSWVPTVKEQQLEVIFRRLVRELF
ncbi:MAG: replication initiator protein A [Blastocatellia bacterium]